MAPQPDGGKNTDTQRARAHDKLAARGLSLARVHFLPLVPAAHHLRRAALADLHLDTLPYNAHSTAADAAFAGLPLLTVAGEQLASRLAAALLRAVSLAHTTLDSLRALETAATLLLHGRSASEPRCLDVRRKSRSVASV